MAKLKREAVDHVWQSSASLIFKMILLFIKLWPGKLRLSRAFIKVYQMAILKGYYVDSDGNKPFIINGRSDRI